MRAWHSLVLVILACAPIIAQAPQAQAKHARIELVAGNSEDKEDLLLGVHFSLEKGWHVYWTNPGDSGQPPSFAWQLPSGFTAGEVLWPVPQRLQPSPTITDYGYANDVLLMVPVTTPPAWNRASSFEVGVNAKWLICREVCIPDHAELKLSSSAASLKDSATQQLFAAAKKVLPQPWPKQWRLGVESRKDDFVLTVTTGKSIRSAEFFPLDPGQIENAARQRVKPTSRGVKIVLRKSDLLLKPISHLRGVLVIDGQAGYKLQATVAAQVAIE